MKEGPILSLLDVKERRSKTELGSIPPDSGSDELDEPVISDVSTPPKNKRRSVYTDGEQLKTNMSKLKRQMDA